MAYSANNVEKERLSLDEMKPLQELLIDEGWIEIHDSRAVAVWDELPVQSRLDPICHLEGYFVFLGKGKKPDESFSKNSQLASLSLLEAKIIANCYLSETFVILTRKQIEAPREGYLIRFQDWLKLEDLKKLGAHSSSKKQYLPTLQILTFEERKHFELKEGTVDAETLVSFECALINNAPFLGDVWSITGARCSRAEIQVRDIMNTPGFHKSVGDGCQIERLHQRYLLHCYFHLYWENGKTNHNERAQNLASFIPDPELANDRSAGDHIKSKGKPKFKGIHRSLVSADQIETGCRDASPSTAKQIYKSLAKSVRTLSNKLPDGPYWIKTCQMLRLLSIVRPRAYADLLCRSSLEREQPSKTV